MRIPIQLRTADHEYTRTAIVDIQILSDGLCDIHPNYTKEQPTPADLAQILSQLPAMLSPSLADTPKPVLSEACKDALVHITPPCVAI